MSAFHPLRTLAVPRMIPDMLWLLASSSLLSPPLPQDFMDWYRPEDVPAYHIHNGISRVVGIRLTVRPDGSLKTCEVENSGGDSKLAAFTCALTSKRAKFRPARWIDGSPAYGVFRTYVGWAIDVAPPLTAGDLTLTVNELPRGERSPAYAQAVFAVDAFGKPSFCSAEPRHVRGMKNNIQLVQMGCEELLKSYTAVPARDEAGRPVQSVQNAVVRFIKQRKTPN